MIIGEHCFEHRQLLPAFAHDPLEDLRCREVLDNVKRVAYVVFTLLVLLLVVLYLNTFGNPILECQKLLAEPLPFIVLPVSDGRHARSELLDFFICPFLIDVQLVRDAALPVDGRFLFRAPMWVLLRPGQGVLENVLT